MGYSADAVTVFGIQIPVPYLGETRPRYDFSELKRIANIFFPTINLSDEDSPDVDALWGSIQSGIQVKSGFPYELKQYDNGDYESAWFLILDEIGVPIVPNPGPIVTEIQPPGEEEVSLFINFLRSNGINYPYSQFLVISGSF